MKGDGDGAGFDAVLAPSGGMPRMPLPIPPGENRDGTVPALARRVCGRVSATGSAWVKSGKPSVGDSGMFSRREVEFPLVGGPPHRLTGKPETPSWAWISRALLVQTSQRSVTANVQAGEGMEGGRGWRGPVHQTGAPCKRTSWSRSSTQSPCRARGNRCQSV